MSEAFVTFREALEAALIVGILARYVPQRERTWLWGGIFSAIGVSIAAAIALAKLSAIHQAWEVIFSILAAGMLIYMVVWMQRRGASLSSELREAAKTSAGWLLFSLSFTAVLREGLETVLFLRTLWAMQQKLSWIGGILGVFVAVALGVLLFWYGKRVPLRPFFQVTSVLLLLIAAGMAAYAAHELLEMLESRYEWAEELAEAKAWSLFPPRTEVPQDYAWAYTFQEGQYFPPFHHKGWIGGIVHAFTGWRASMSWVEVIVWGLTLSGGLYLWRRYRPEGK
ncbi:MAG: FTR1 family protein [Bacteroidia bacterium]|nr:FTR1 family protein [Bacteroidia bacterium]